MARGFGITYGVDANTDAITSARTTGYPTTCSIHIWVYRNGDGGGGFGRLYQNNDIAITTGLGIFNTGTGLNTLTFLGCFTPTAGNWNTTSTISNGSWVPVGAKFNGAADTNDPTLYVNHTKETVGSGLTEAVAPSGAYVGGSGFNVMVGNRQTANRAWNGMLAEFAMWDALLDDGEFDALADGYSALFIRPSNLIEYLPMVRANHSYVISAPTITGTAVQPHPRIIMPRGPKVKRYRPVVSAQVYLYMRPDADDTDGTWTNELDSNVNLFASIDETSASDADYIKSANVPVNDLCKISLSNPSSTPGEPFYVRYRYKKVGSGQIDLRVQVLEGTTVIATYTHTDISATYVMAEQTLSGAEFAAITDMTNLFIEFRANAP